METYIPGLFEGIDRNAANITYGNEKKVLQFNLSKVEQIARTTTEIKSFRRNDARINKSIASKYRRSEKQKGQANSTPRVKEYSGRCEKNPISDILRRYQRDKKPLQEGQLSGKKLST